MQLNFSTSHRACIYTYCHTVHQSLLRFLRYLNFLDCSIYIAHNVYSCTASQGDNIIMEYSPFLMRRGYKLLVSFLCSVRCPYGVAVMTVQYTQSGRARYALFALLLLTLPEVLIFHALYALPRLAERKRTFTAVTVYSLRPLSGRPYFNKSPYRFWSASHHARSMFLTSIVLPPQYLRRFVLK